MSAGSGGEKPVNFAFRHIFCPPEKFCLGDLRRPFEANGNQESFVAGQLRRADRLESDEIVQVANKGFVGIFDRVEMPASFCQVRGDISSTSSSRFNNCTWRADMTRLRGDASRPNRSVTVLR